MACTWRLVAPVALLVLVVSCAIHELSTVAALGELTYVFDETLWTKSRWEDNKLSLELDANPSDEANIPTELYPLLASSHANSLDGPLPRRQAAAGSGTGSDSAAAHPYLFTAAAMADAASGAVSCAVCEELTRAAWSELAESLQQKGYMVRAHCHRVAVMARSAFGSTELLTL